MKYVLKSITKKNKGFAYHFEITSANETSYVEMRKDFYSPKSIYLRCTTNKCNARIILGLKPPLLIEKVGKGRQYNFVSNVSEDQILDINNYEEKIHTHRFSCKDIRPDGTCQVIRHGSICLKQICQDKRRKYRAELIKAVKQNPFRENQEIFRIVNTKFNLIREYSNKIVQFRLGCRLLGPSCSRAPETSISA